MVCGARVVLSSTSGETVRELALVRGACVVSASTSGEIVRELAWWWCRHRLKEFGSSGGARVGACCSSHFDSKNWV